MVSFGIFVQETVPDELSNAVAATANSSTTPFFDGPANILWIVVVSCFLIFFSIIYLMMRSRVLRDARAEKAAKAKYFQPAGADAEITFDDEQSPANQNGDLATHHQDRSTDADYSDDDLAEVVIERPAEARNEALALTDRDQPNGYYEADAQADDRFDAPAEAIKSEKKKKKKFGGLFSRKKKSETADETLNGDIADTTLAPPDTGFAPRDDAQIGDNDVRPGAFFQSRRTDLKSSLYEENNAFANDDAASIKQQAEADAAEIRRQAEYEARRREDEQARIAAERDAEFERQRLAQREADFEARKREAALAQQQAHSSEAVIETAVSRALEEKFAALENKIGAGAPALAANANSDAAMMAGADLISQRLKDHRESVDTALMAMNERLNQIAEPAELEALRADIADLRNTLTLAQTSTSARPAAANFSSPIVQLGDILRNALPPDAYQFNALLSNNRKADCLILLPQPPGPVAVDASFPLEAWSSLQRAFEDRENNETAENEFRRTALRHIVDIAERLIIPDQTAESALMFIPSEQVYADIQARFPDVVQDGYRARVWIVSPTTLMATLHTIRAILRDADMRTAAADIHEEATHVLGEVDDLRHRVADLERNFDQTRSNVRDVLTSTDQVWRRAEKITRSGQTMAAHANGGGFDRDGRYAIHTGEPAPAQSTMPPEPPAAPVRGPVTPTPAGRYDGGARESFAEQAYAARRGDEIRQQPEATPRAYTPAPRTQPPAEAPAPSFGYGENPVGHEAPRQRQPQADRAPVATRTDQNAQRARPAPPTTLSRPTDPDAWDKDALRQTESPSFPLR